MVKRLPAMQETQVRSLGQEDPLEKEMATHFSTPAWKIPWMEEPGRLQSMESQNWTRLSNFTFYDITGKGPAYESNLWAQHWDEYNGHLHWLILYESRHSIYFDQNPCSVCRLIGHDFYHSSMGLITWTWRKEKQKCNHLNISHFHICIHSRVQQPHTFFMFTNHN